MGGNRQGAIRDASQGGVAGEHSDADPLQFLVGTTTTDQLNTLTLRLIPIACWRVDDIRFAFDSSFVNVDSSADSASTPSDIRAELKHLSKLVKDHPACRCPSLAMPILWVVTITTRHSAEEEPWRCMRY